MAKITTEKELGEALKRNEDTIEITGDLAKKTIRLRATGKVAWAIAIAAIGIAVYSAISVPATGGTSTPAAVTMAGIAAPAAVGILGGAATYSAIAIAIAAGGVGALTSLRGYKEISRTSSSLVLKRSQ